MIYKGSYTCSNWDKNVRCTNKATHFYTAVLGHYDHVLEALGEFFHCCFCDTHYIMWKTWVTNGKIMEITEEEYTIEEVLEK
jgi:hypothetical protein